MKNPLQRLDWRNPLDRAHPLNAGRYLWWLAAKGRMGGSTFVDLCRSRDGSLVNAPAWAATDRPGGLGQLTLDGSSQYASATATVSTRVSYACWFNVQPGHWPGLLGTFDGSIASGTHDRELIVDLGTPKFSVYDGATKTAASSTSVIVGAWHRLLGTADGMNVTLYLDGVQVGQAAAGNPYTGYSSPLFAAGYATGSGNPYLGGYLDDVAVWTRALSAEEARLDYDLSRLGYPGVLNVAGPRRAYFGAASAGGTTFTSSLSGSLTASAVLARSAGKAPSGGLTASGSLARSTGKAPSGGLTASGSLSRRAGKALAGTLASSATLARSTGKALSGTLTASGSAVAAIRTRLVALAGTLTASGSAVARSTGKALAGTLAASGSLSRRAGKALAGSTSASATFSAARAVLMSLSGTLTASGSLAKATSKALAGTLTASGSIRKAIAKGLAGLTTASGAFLKSIGGLVLDTSRHPDPSRSSGTRRGPDPSRSVARRGQD